MLFILRGLILFEDFTSINYISTTNVNRKQKSQYHRPVGRGGTRSSPERKVRGSNLGPAISDKLLPTARHRCGISLKGAVLPERYDAEMGPANSLHVSAQYSKHNERFDDPIPTN